ncbi:MAG: hypothetical protein GY862_12475 [Gammaproteobacteria bacterium]|nr:hypothetical protein [Gammaproteobacteria bacterium]
MIMEELELMSSKLEALISKLHRFNPTCNAEELADALWYAAVRYAPEQPAVTAGKLFQSVPEQSYTPILPQVWPHPSEAKPVTFPDVLKEKHISDEPGTIQEESSLDVYPAAPKGKHAAHSHRGLPIRIPGGRALPHALAISRALRPLMRRISSPDQFVLDEEATVQQIARTDLWLPLFKPASVRWLELALVVEDSPSMRIWRHTVKEFQTLLEQQSAFRELRVWVLKTSGKTQDISLHAENNQTPRHPGELLNPARPRLILVVTDCVSPAWQSKGLINWLDNWGRHHPTTLVQLLPQNLWRKSRLRAAQRLKVVAPYPASPNRYLLPQEDAAFLFDEDEDERNAPQPLPIPLTTLEPDFIRGWAKFIAGHGGIRMPAFILSAALPITPPAVAEINEAKQKELLDRFHAVATPAAYELACCFAAAPLRLPILRLVQQVMLPESGQTQLAEFFLSGLIFRLTPDEKISDPDEIEYEFIGGIREELLKAGFISDALKVQDVLSDYIAERYGCSIDFRAILLNPEGVGGHQVEKGQKSFARILINTIRDTRIIVNTLQKLSKKYIGLLNASLKKGADFIPAVQLLRRKMASSGSLLLPNSPEFSAYLESPEKCVDDRERSIIRVTGCDNAEELLIVSQWIASGCMIPGEIELGIRVGDTIVLSLTEANGQQANELGGAIENAFGGRSRIQADVATETFRDYLLSSLTVTGPNNQHHELQDIPASTPLDQILAHVTEHRSASGQKDWPQDAKGEDKSVVVMQVKPDIPVQRLQLDISLYENQVEDGDQLHVNPEMPVIPRIYVEGPDSARFELTDVPLTTRISEIARATLTEYDDKIWPHDNTGYARPAVVDRVTRDEGHERINPNSTVEENNFCNEETLLVSPESTAGSVNPLIREEALARVRIQILGYAKSHPGFQVQANAMQTPTEYILTFAAKSFGPPLSSDRAPYSVDEHQVFVFLPADFPMKAPQVFWQTPIFHPNVHPKNGEVCMGVLQNNYTPGLDFTLLCQMLVDMAGYQNYALREYYNAQAAKWVQTEEGQAAIKARGGRPITEWLLELFEGEIATPPSLNMQKLERS